jgi:integrase/recombinase XerC
MLEGKELNEELVRRFDRWLFTQKYTDPTRERYVSVVLRFCSYFRTRSVITANHFDIREFLAVQSTQGDGLPTLRGKLYGLRIFFDFLNMGGLVRWVAPRLVAVRPSAPKLPRFLSEMQIYKLLRATRNSRDRALVELIYGTGCRTCEITSMRVEDIDFVARKIRVVGKKNRTRFVLFGRPAAKALREYLRRRQSGYVFLDGRPEQKGNLSHFPGRGWCATWRQYSTEHPNGVKCRKFFGLRAARSFSEATVIFENTMSKVKTSLIRPRGLKPMCGSSLCNTIRVIGARAGIERVTPRMLRHSYATHLLDHGADVRVIQELLGHQKLQTTQVYTHVSPIQAKRTYTNCHPRGH